MMIAIKDYQNQKIIVEMDILGSNEIVRKEYPLFIDAGATIKSSSSKKRNKKSKKEVDNMVKFSELKPKLDLPSEKREIDDLKDETFEITKAIVNKSQFHNGDYAIVVAKQGKKEFYFTTSSEVLVRQLKDIIIPALEKEPVEVTLRKPKGKRYYTFE